MLWFSLTQETLLEAPFHAHERVFKGGVWHGMVEGALAIHAPSLLALLTQGRGGHQRAFYALMPPLDDDALYSASAPRTWSLILYGQACQHWHQILLALLEPHALKLGHSRVSVRIRKIESLHPQFGTSSIYDMDVGRLGEVAVPIHVALHDHCPTNGAALQLLTPVNISLEKLRPMGLHEAPIALERWIKALRRRLSELEPELAEQFEFDGASWQKQERALRDVDVASFDLAVLACRWKSRTKSDSVLLRGQTGRMRFDGEIPARTHALLDLGQWLGIGQKTTMGFGWYRLLANKDSGAANVHIAPPPPAPDYMAQRC